MSRIIDFMKRRPIISTLLGGAVVLGGVGAVSAQYYGGPGHWGHGGWGRQARMERFCNMPSARFQPVARAYIKADLNLTPAQAAEFDKLADVIAPAFEEIKGDLCGSLGANAPKITPPEKLEKIAVALRKAATAAENAVGPAKSLYGQLDDAQKAQIDRKMEQRRMMREGHRQGEQGDQRGNWRGREQMGEHGYREGRGRWNREGQGGWGRGPGGQDGYGQTPNGPGGPFHQGGQQ